MLNEVKEKADRCCLALDLCLDSPSRTAKFGKEYIADGELLRKWSIYWI